VVLRERSKWREPNGEIRTAGQLQEVLLPAATAERALRNNMALDPSSEIVARLRAVYPTEWQPFHPDHAINDLDGEPQSRAPKYSDHTGDVTDRVAPPAVHSLIGEPRIGPARTLSTERNAI
jgi:hypothetical protein